MYEFKNFLIDLRRYWGYTQSELAVKTGIPEETISNWERGKRNPREENVERLNQFYGFDIFERFYSRKYILEESKNTYPLFEPDPKVISNPNAEMFTIKEMERNRRKLLRQQKNC